MLVFTCHPQEMTAERIAESGDYCTWSLPSPGPLGPVGHHQGPGFDGRTGSVRRTSGPATRRRLGTVGFRNLEPKGIDAFDITDPIPVTLDEEGYLVAR